MTMTIPKVLVLGVGNILMSDEGSGVHCLWLLERRYSFSEDVELLDGGTLGMRLLGPISRASRCIVVDVAKRGLPPGTVGLLSSGELNSAIPPKNSMHQVSFQECLATAGLLGILPPTVIAAIEPHDIETMSTSLSAPVAAGLEELCSLVLRCVGSMGGSFQKRKLHDAGWWRNPDEIAAALSHQCYSKETV